MISVIFIFHLNARTIKFYEILKKRYCCFIRFYEDREVISHSSQDPKISDFVGVPPTVTKQAASVDQLAIEEVLLYSTNGTVYRGAQ